MRKGKAKTMCKAKRCNKTMRKGKAKRCNKTRRKTKAKTIYLGKTRRQKGGLWGFFESNKKNNETDRDKDAREWLEALGPEWRVGRAGGDNTIIKIEERLNDINGVMGTKYINLSECLMTAGNINGERVTAQELITFKQCVEPKLIELFELMSDKEFLKRDLIEKYSGYKREIEELFKANEGRLFENVVAATGATPTDIDRDVKKILSYNIEKIQRKEIKEGATIGRDVFGIRKPLPVEVQVQGQIQEYNDPLYTGLGGKRSRSKRIQSRRSGKRSRRSRRIRSRRSRCSKTYKR